jgi:folate-dependent phosphoribosylglycinamide formyltransferase PurN
MPEMMNQKELRVIILTHGGAEQILARLCALPCVSVAGVFVETQLAPERGLREKIKRSIRYNGYAATAAKFARKLLSPDKAGNDEVSEMRSGQDALSEAARRHDVPAHLVANYHERDAIELMRAADADLGIIYGTNIVKESVFKIPRLGSINLHQGLAPFYRGGPPVFWELFNDEPEVGLTVHYVAAKVDSGEIILQETVPLVYDYSYGLNFESFISDYRARLTDRSAALVAEAVRLIAEGEVAARPQDTSLGKRYRLPTKKEKDELSRRLRGRRRAAVTREATAQRLSAED